MKLYIAIHRPEELLVGGCFNQPVPEKLHGFHRVHVGEVVAKNPNFLENLLT